MRGMNRLGYCGVLFSIVLSSACASSQILMQVEALRDQQRTPQPGQTFRVLPTGEGHEYLREAELLAMVKAGLEQRGFRYDEASPDLLVFAHGYISQSSRDIPPATIQVPTTITSTGSTTVTGSVGGTPVWGTGTSTTTTQGYTPVTLPGQRVIEYYRYLTVTVYQSGDSQRPPIWSGQVRSTGSTGDLLYVAPYLLDGLLTEFPNRSGLPGKRAVAFNPPPR
jgi:Domain of unknown function (DUF4136)